jgi:hypothetical protein
VSSPFNTRLRRAGEGGFRAIGIPRSAAIAYPYGRPVGQVGDREGQRKVLLETLEVLEKAKKPGEIWHLPFTWPEEPKKTDWQPPEMSPLIKFYLEDIKKARREQEGLKTLNQK